MSFIRVFALIYGVSISGSTDLPTMSNVSTDLPTISPSTIRPTDLPTGSPLTIQPTDLPTISPSTIRPTDLPTGSPSTISPSTIQPTALPTISPVTMICPQVESQRIFLSHFQIEEKKCINTPVEERGNLMKNILEQIADIPEPDASCVHLEIINVECGSYYVRHKILSYRMRRR
eukprot:253917_1